MGASERLAGFRFAAELSDAARRQLDATLVTSRIESPATLIRRGELIAGAYLVLEGSLRVYTMDTKGREATLYTVGANDACIFAMNCAFHDLRYPAWVENDDVPTQLAVIPSKTYRQLHALDIAVQRFTFDVLSGRIFDLMSAIEELSSLDTSQRLASLLVRKCDEQGRVRTSHARIAAHLGTAREVVTRQLGRFEARGLLETTRGEIRILDPVALAAHSDD